jgi:lysine 2,3-aminomutase
MPNYLVSASDDAVVLRNFEGLLVRYQAEDKLTTVQPTATRGVSALLQGTKSALVPNDSERMARRRLHAHNPYRQDGDEPHPNGHHTNGHGNGCCGGNDRESDLIPLEILVHGQQGHSEELVSLHDL